MKRMLINATQSEERRLAIANAELDSIRIELREIKDLLKAHNKSH